MKSTIITILSFILVIGCNPNKLSHVETATKYFNARNSSEFVQIQELIADSLTIVEGDYIMPYSKDEYYEVFKWDSTFQTRYEVVELQETNDQVIASITLSSIKHKFLKNDRMTCTFKLSFEEAKISKIESLDCKGADWEIWEKQVNILVEWVAINHPELDGFIYDMTLNGAQNYVKAIQLHESRHDE